MSANVKRRHFLLCTKGSHQSSNFDTFECSGENLPNSSCHFQASQFFFKFSTTLQFHERELLCTFVVQTIYILVTSSQLKQKFFRHLSASVKICEVPHVNLKR